MISCLWGTLVEKKPPELLINVNDVGYEVFAPMSTFYQLPTLNETVQLYTHLVVREDALTLYGFYTPAERTLFRTLIKVNGVGPKLALTILSGMALDEFIQCIQGDNVKKLSSIPGIGPKTAKRLIVEIRDILLKSELMLPTTTSDDRKQDSTLSFSNQAMQDALGGLISLGYKSTQAKQVLQMIYQPDMTSENLIRLALQHIV
jgi:Holliday junction DNA helicase RuvA